MIEPIAPQQLDAALPYLLAADGQARVSPDQFASFHTYVRESALDWRGWRRGPVETPQALVVALLLPGNTAILLTPAPSSAGVDAGRQGELLRHVLAELSHTGLHYVQALVEPKSQARRALLGASGFRLLAPLIYLERSTMYPWTDPPDDAAAQWWTYTPERQALFADVVQQTYRDSRDCPELTGLRPIEDVLSAHRASGRYEAELWAVAAVDERPAGCLLLSLLNDGALLEVVYMGVLPEFRRRGLGSVMLRRAIATARARRARRVTVVVDGRNEPARRLYAGFALQAMAEREAWIYRWESARRVDDSRASGAQPVDNL